MADKTIWAPWRSDFILGKRERGCVFCRLRAEKTLKLRNLILYRTEKSYIVMNKFPYNIGHLLVVPNRHIGLLERLTSQESKELIELSQLAVRVMKSTLKPEGFNLGLNLGRPAGAGIPRHLHMHIVPRWTGDANFMPIVGKARVHSIPMEQIYKTLREGFSEV